MAILNVIQVMAGDEEGGLENHFIEMSNALAASCNVTTIAHAKYAGRLGEGVHHINVDLSKPRLYPGNLIKLTTAIRRTNPHIVHAHASKAGSIIALCKPLLSAKTVATVHNIKKHMSFLSAFDLAIGVSNTVRDTLPCSNKISIYNGVNWDVNRVALRPPEYQPVVDSQKHIVAAIGRLVPAKGFDLLISAWEPKFGCLFVIGEGPEHERLEALVNARGLADSVFLLGHKNPAIDYISSADLVVIPSRNEGFSYVFAEALLERTPVISTNVPIPNEVLPKEYLCTIDSVEAIGQLLETTLSDMSGLEHSFSPLFDYAKKNLTLSRSRDKTLAAYSALIE